MSKLFRTAVISLMVATVAIPASAANSDKRHHKNVVVQKQVTVVEKTTTHKKVVKQKQHKHAVGKRVQKQNVTVIKDWQRRGLRRPAANEVYVVDGNDIYLAAAATMLIKALID
ncbi:hypothetical protein GCM10008927_00710 [Amylibacter ulvae]|uniref:Regulator RcnB of Ni and Co efflux n=1 Tax=Paramylibacter ulvae TaxID=1651968 RepID=A0ABQ3CRB2_9RHOB|nr:RcnB family protein [Amylibacter ulvae]GHA40427.1 hypothetical protein GCM10008927_00710 [Amylibacter ulvae]